MEGLLACVLMLVQYQALVLLKGVKAFTTVVNCSYWPLSHEGMACWGLVAVGSSGSQWMTGPGTTTSPSSSVEWLFSDLTGKPLQASLCFFFYMGPLMDCQINLQAEALPTVRAQECLLLWPRKDTGRLSHSLC